MGFSRCEVIQRQLVGARACHFGRAADPEEQWEHGDLLEPTHHCVFGVGFIDAGPDRAASRDEDDEHQQDQQHGGERQ